MSTPESPSSAPCDAWITAADVAAVCAGLDATGQEFFDEAAEKASDVLFLLSGRVFPGLCEATVRPCGGGCDCLPAPGWSRGGRCWVSRILLAGYPLREVSEVKIDGTVLDPAEYRLDQRRYLTRLPDVDDTLQRRRAWPRCQRLDLEDTEDGTFSVTYSYGQDPPILGRQAAAQLACQLAIVDAGGECSLPAGTTKVTRQGITVDVSALLAGAQTGLVFVDLFLRTYNPQGLARVPSVWSPDVDPYPQRVG